MSLAADKKRWDDLHAALEKAHEAVSVYDRQLFAHYGRYENNWLTKIQRSKLEALHAKEEKIGDKIFELVTKISPRDWYYGASAWWVRRELTWEDAIRPKSEPLSVVVPGSYGTPDGTVKEEVQMPRKTSRKGAPNAEATGEQYATDQIASTYFGDWVRDQMLEASRMPPDQVLPLETKADAKVIAKNMLQQLEWDTKRDMSGNEISSLLGTDDVSREAHKEFYEGFRKGCDASRDWLADELLTINREISGGSVVSEATPSSPASVLRTLQPGDFVTVESPELRQPRKLVVTKLAEGGVYVTSGHSAPGQIKGGRLHMNRDGVVLYSATIQQRDVRVSRLTRTAAAMAESRRGRRGSAPLIDDKVYSVTWAGGRQGNLTDREAVDLVRQLRDDWVQNGRHGILNVQIWYRDGSQVPYADLERKFYPTGSPIPGRAGFAGEARTVNASRSSKPFFGQGDGAWVYGIKINGIENDFPLKPLGRQTSR